MDNQKYDLIIMVTKTNIEILKQSVPYILKNINAQNISFVANANLRQEISQFSGISFIDENSILSGMSINTIKNTLNKRCGNGQRAGWYFQQFLKMAYAYVCPYDYYVVWDSDTIPLNPINYFDDGKPIFVKKKEYHMPYFNTIDKLFNGEVERYHEDVSFVAENMIMNKHIMLELISKIESNDDLLGEIFYDKILNSIDLECITESGFSEFETYGNYVMRYYPNQYSITKFRTFRLGRLLLGSHPSLEQLMWAGESYDIVSIENHGPNWMSHFTKFTMCRKLLKANQVAGLGMWLRKFLNSTLLKRDLIEYDWE